MNKNTESVRSYVKALLGAGAFASSLAFGTTTASGVSLENGTSECVAWGDNYVKVGLELYSGGGTDWSSVDYSASATTFVLEFSSDSGADPRNLFIEPYFYSDSDCATTVQLAVSACLAPVNPGGTDNYPAEPYPYGFEAYLANSILGGDGGVQLTWQANAEDVSFYPDYNYSLYQYVPVPQPLSGSLVLTLLSSDQIDELGDNTVDSSFAASLCDASAAGGGGGGSWSGPDIDIDHYRRLAEQASALPDTL